MTREGATIPGHLAVPHSTSTLDFERYLPTTPVLSSREANWEHLVLRTYHEPAQLVETFFPAGPDIYLVLVTGGSLQVDERKFDGPWSTYTIHAGDWFLTPAASEPYALRWHNLSPDPITTLHLHLSADLFLRTAQQATNRDPARVLVQDLTGFQDPLLAHIGLTLQKELQQPGPGSVSRLYAETAAQMLAAHLLRYYTTTTIPIREETRKLSSQQIRRLTTFVRDHLAQDLSLETLAQQVGFSPYHFTRLFRQTTGVSPHQFVLGQRLEAAALLLRETDLPLIQVTLTVGFQQQSHFTQAFKRRFGTTPLTYRQK